MLKSWASSTQKPEFNYQAAIVEEEQSGSQQHA